MTETKTKRIWMFWILGIVAVIMLIVTISSDLFSIWTFLGMIYMIMLHIVALIYVKRGHAGFVDAQDIINKDRKKFPWCWQRINYHLKNGFGDGIPLEWNKGYTSKSAIAYFHDGVQFKPFRSIRGQLSGNQNRDVVVIYDIDGDDIAVYDSDPSVERINNHFYNFDPYKGRGGGDMRQGDRFGQYGNQDRYGYGQGNQYVPNQPMMQQQQYPQQPPQMPTPSPEGVKKAIAKIK